MPRSSEALSCPSMIVACEYVSYVVPMKPFKIAGAAHPKNIEVDIGFVGLGEEYERKRIAT
jgi:hypothetical protein